MSNDIKRRSPIFVDLLLLWVLDNTSMSNISRAKPFVKWAGGKTQLLPQIQQRLPKKFNNYFEPFVGGGALFFHLKPSSNSTLIDVNFELITTYRIIKERVEKLINQLRLYENSKEEYYRVRKLAPDGLTTLEIAARFLYLNRLCFNGLYRVNQKGVFNVPYGSNKKSIVVDEENLRNVSRALRDVNLVQDSYLSVKKMARPGDFIYFDPPYYPVNGKNGFTSYSKDGFKASDHEALFELFSELDRRGCYVMLSNSDANYIRDLYKEYQIDKVLVNWMINCIGKRRTNISEIIIRNY